MEEQASALLVSPVIYKNGKLKLDSDSINSLINSNEQEGSNLYFFSINDIGYKLFFHKDDRDNAYKNNMLVYNADKNLAPQPFDKFYCDYKTTRYHNQERMYGYTVELIETINDDEDAWSWYYKRQKTLAPIIAKLYKIGFIFDDTHMYNWGIKNGKYIPIDFDSGFGS